tara:strand:+ start:265 stop:834 length:570 start_codon:yes stop_codon:yes gene_type:complete
MIAAIIFEIVIVAIHFEELFDDNKYITLFSIVSVCINLFVVLSAIGTFGPLYLSVHRPFNNTNMFTTASDLLECASFKSPHLQTEFKSIHNCLETVDIYDVRNGRVPYLRSVPQAFVLTFDDKSVFVSEKFASMPLIDRALIMIHECAHIGIGAIDHAYMWEERYKKLTYKQHMDNADSFMHVVLSQCT